MQYNLIFDLGLHKGEDSEFYLKKGFRVIGVDASGELCRFCRNRLKKYIDNGSLVILNYAIGTKNNQPTTFYKNLNNSVWGTTDINWAKRNEKFGTVSVAVEVETIRLDTLIKKYGVPYYLKVDIEGMDLLAVKQLLHISEKPQYLSIESEKRSWKKLLEECSFLKELGYTEFKIINQKKINTQRSPDKPLEGKSIAHVFEEGCSGLFGKELPGSWMSYKECIRFYKGVFIKYKLFGDFGWFNNRFFRSILYMMKIKYPDVGWYDTHVTYNHNKI